MKNKPEAANELSAEQKQQLEADYTFRRAVELELDPVRGNFDATHLKEVNRRLFQDLPGAGIDDVTPGEFRKPVPDGKDWMKQRGLSTVEGPFYVAYSSMDATAIARLDKALERANPHELRGLKTPEFTAQLTKLYVDLDYVHPFIDGNSRTLRTFTKQLAKEAGYEIDWERFGRSEVSRDLLYIARDLSVNELAKPYVQHENTMRKILHTQDRLNGNPALPDLLRDAVRPSRAVAFEKLPEAEALRAYPELKAAFFAVHKAGSYFAEKLPGDSKGQEAGIKAVAERVQACLNAGEITDFSRSRGQGRGEQEIAQRNPSEHNQEPER